MQSVVFRNTAFSYGGNARKIFARLTVNFVEFSAVRPLVYINELRAPLEKVAGSPDPGRQSYGVGFPTPSAESLNPSPIYL